MSTQPRRLNVGTLKPRDVILTIGDVEYEIRGDIPTEGMIELLMIHKKLEALEGEGEDDAIVALGAVEDANKLILRMIHERYPDADIPSFGVQEVTGILGFLVGNDGGPIAAVEEALVDGVPPPTDAEIEARIVAAVERQRMVDAGLIEDVPPTIPSRSDSSTHSSTLGSTSDGNPNGGSESPGEVSELTASTPTDT